MFPRPPRSRSLYDTDPVKELYPQNPVDKSLIQEIRVPEVEIIVVAGLFQARSGKEAELAAVLARYVVLTRSVTGCRNVDWSPRPPRPDDSSSSRSGTTPQAQRPISTAS